MKCSNYLLLFQWEFAIDIHFHFISLHRFQIPFRAVHLRMGKSCFHNFYELFRNLIKKNPIKLLGWAQSIRTCWGGCETSAEDIKKLFHIL